jgi:L-lactate dehydrogenase complex protein LldG
LNQAWIEYPDPYQQFADTIAAVGGRCFAVGGVADINRLLDETPAYAVARQIVSLLPGAGSPNVDLNSIDDPHALEAVDFAILPGHWGVAENGAIWVTDAGLKHRVIYFITQHLALVIPANQILHNMHQAYERLTFDGATFGTFISGPSKTAEIEQSLVIGAHGPRSLTVFVLA